MESMPIEDLLMLIELINKRIIEKHRIELVAEDREGGRHAFERGEVKRGTFEDLMKDLQD